MECRLLSKITKSIFIILLFFCGPFLVVGAEEQYSKPYLNWLSLSDEDRQRVPEPDKYATEFIPTPKFSLLTDGFGAISQTEVLPSYYDGREYGYVTPVKNQGQTNLCWAFAATSALESNILINGGNTYNFNALHVSNSLAYKFSDYINPYGYQGINTAGWFEKTLDYWTSGLGPVTSFGGNGITALTAKKTLLSSEDIQVDEAYNLPYFDIDNNSDAALKEFISLIKKEIMTNGSVVFSGASPQSASGFTLTTDDGATYKCGNPYNSSYYSVYTDNYYDYACSPHLMIIVGWDDSFSKEKFKSGLVSGEGPNQDGAWIVKNSWGISSNKNGYVYYSYEDYNLVQYMHSISKASTKDYDAIYQYAPTGQWSSSYNTAINVFDKSKNTEYLNEISFHLTVDGGQNTNVSYKIYVNANDGDTDSENMKLVKTYINTSQYDRYYTGYKTIKLDNPIELSGEQFVVKVEVENGSIKFNNVINEEISSDNLELAGVMPQQSFRISSGKVVDSYPYMAQIKAFTTTATDVTEQQANTVLKYDEIEYPLTQHKIYLKSITNNVANASFLDYQVFNKAGQNVTENFTFNKGMIINNSSTGSMKITSDTEEDLYTINTLYEGKLLDTDYLDLRSMNIDLSELIYEPVEIYETIGGTISFSARTIGITDDELKIIIKDDNGSDVTEKFDITGLEIVDNLANIVIGIDEAIPSGDYIITVSDLKSEVSSDSAFTIKEYIQVESVVLNKEKLELLKGSIETLNVTINPDNVYNDDVSWSSSNTNVATVDENGLVKALSRGTTTITVTSEDGNKTDTLELTVLDPTITIGNTVINSNVDNNENKIYLGYGGTIETDITTVDIGNESILGISIKKDSVDRTSNFVISGNEVSNNTANIVIKVERSSNAIAGTYQVEVTYENAETKNYEFTLYEPIKVTGIELNQTTINLLKGSTHQIQYEVKPSNALNKNLTFKSNSDSIATVNSEGVITGVSKGQATITISTNDGSGISKNIAVNVVEKKITLGQTSYSDEIIYDDFGGYVTIPVTLENYDNNVSLNVKITSNSQVVTNNFVITGNNINSLNGNIKIEIPQGTKAATYEVIVEKDGISETTSFIITPYIHVSSVTLNKDILTLIKGKTEDLEVTINPSNALNSKVTWNSSNTNAATVDQNGLITAVGRGTTVITVTSEDGNKTDTCEVIVLEPKLIIGKTTISSNYDNILYQGYGGKVITNITTQDIEEDSKLTLKYYKGTTEMTNEEVSNVFKVDGNVVKNNKVDLQVEVKSRAVIGTYKIELSYENAETRVFEFEVKEPILVQEIQASDVTIEINQSKKVNYTIVNDDALNKNVTFSIRNKDDSLTTSVAVVDGEGNVTGKHIGEAILTISSKDGGASKEVNVKVIERKISLSEVGLEPNPLYDYIGGKVSLNATLKNISSNKVTVDVYKVGTESIITKEFNVVNNIANIELDIPKGVRHGTYTIKVSTGEFEATKTFVVTEYIHVESVVLNKDKTTLLKGSTEALNVTINPSNALNPKVTWNSSNENVATVDQNGLITAVGRGTTVITVTSEDGNKTDTCEVIVLEPKLIIGKTTISSNYDNILYQGYGGKVITNITTQDINNDEKLNIKYYKNDVELNNMEQIFGTSGNFVKENNVTLELNIPNDSDIGKYRIELRYENAETRVFEFEVKEPILVQEIQASDVTITLNNISDLEVDILPSNALNKNVDFKIADETVAIIEDGKIKGLKVGNTTLIIKALDGSKVQKEILINVQPSKLELISDSVYVMKEVSGNKYIDNVILTKFNNQIEPLKYQKFISNFSLTTQNTFKLYDKNKLPISDNEAMIKTGMYFDTPDGKYYVVVKGDTNGDGKITITDVSKLYSHIRKTRLMEEGYYLLSGDTNKDNKLTITDVSKLYSFIRKNDINL